MTLAAKRTEMAALSPDVSATAAGVRMNFSKASFDGARMVTLESDPSMSARPGTPMTADVKVDRDEVAPRRSVRDPDELDVELVAFCARVVAANAAVASSCRYMV